MDREYTIKTSEDIKIVLIRRKTLNVISGVACALIFCGVLSFPLVQKVSADNKINCGIFPSRLDAQAAHDSNPSFYKRLDRNGDGVVCTSYKYKN